MFFIFKTINKKSRKNKKLKILISSCFVPKNLLNDETSVRFSRDGGRRPPKPTLPHENVTLLLLLALKIIESVTFERYLLPSFEIGRQRAVVDAPVLLVRRGNGNEDSVEVETTDRGSCTDVTARHRRRHRSEKFRELTHFVCASDAFRCECDRGTKQLYRRP